MPLDAEGLAAAEAQAIQAHELLKAYVLDEFRHEEPRSHVATCPTLKILDLEAADGSYGCETGCDYYTLSAMIGCDHETVKFTADGFGMVYDLINSLSK